MKPKLSLPATHLQGINTKIKLDSDDDEDERYQFEKDTKPGNKKKQDNSEWNPSRSPEIQYFGNKPQEANQMRANGQLYLEQSL